MTKQYILVDPNDKILTSCIQFIADVLGEENFCLLKWSDSWQTNSSAADEDPALPIVDSAKLCHLPIITHAANDYPHICYAGLCTVVRQMVHHAHRQDRSANSISLLGYQETCLKAYAEVSQWTSFCENDFPNAVKKCFYDHLSKRVEMVTADIPSVLLRLEKELATPKNLPNKSKFFGKERAKWLTKLVSESFEGQKIGQSVQSYISAFDEKIGCCKSWSPYLIGFQITVADLLVLSLVAKLLQKLSRHNCLCKLPENIPMVFEWIEMMKVLPCVKAFIESKIQVCLVGTGHSEDSFIQHVCTTWLITQNVIDPVSQTKSEQKTKKFKLDHQKKISVTLSKLEKCGLRAPVLSHMSCPLSIDWKKHSEYINPSRGDLNVQRSLRKQHQISNMLSAVRQLVKPGYRIVDFCAGGGHVGIVLAYFLKDCEVVMVENKEESILRAVKRIKELKLDNIRICHANLNYFCGAFDIGVTLHACGIATDLVLNACYKERASFVVCPCCYGSINSVESISYPRSKKFCDSTTIEEYMVLSRSSDMTTWDEQSMNCQFGKCSMALIDLDRCFHMEELGYETSLQIMIPTSCSPKNHLLIGTRTSATSVCH